MVASPISFNIMNKLKTKLNALTLFFSIFLLGCNEEEFKSQIIDVTDTYVFTDIEYPTLHTSLSNSHPYVFNNGGYIEELGQIINEQIDFNYLQSDTTTLLVYRHDIAYNLDNEIVKVYKDFNGNVKMFVTYEIKNKSHEYENRYLNIICVKIPKIKELNTFSYESAVRVVI